MCFPENIKLPFFSYGLFKPDQLGFYRIEKYVKKSSKAEAPGILKERDGIPLYIFSRYSKIKGYLIEFEDGKENEAYKNINEVEPSIIYEWSEQRFGKDRVNLLKGKKDNKGVFDLEGIEEWDGRDDPLFKQGLQEIKYIIEKNKNEYIKANPDERDYKPFFQLQMAYVFLWSIIERYATMRYCLGGNDIYYLSKNRQQINKDEYFKECLKHVVKDKRSVVRVNDLKEFSLDISNPNYNPLEYYYTIRSNVVHRGKSVPNDFDMLKLTLNELYCIFNDVINNAFDVLSKNNHSRRIKC